MSIKLIITAIFSIVLVSCGGATNSQGESGGQLGESLSFAVDILPIIQARCTPCHSEGSSLPFWEDYAIIFKKRDLVRRRVFELRDMPRGNATNMIDEERELVAAWVDAGAPQ